MTINKMQILGSVGQDPKIATTQAGKKLASFSIATNQSWKDKQSGEKKTKTTWHNVVVFSEGLANVVENYVKKGSKLYIEAPLEKRKYTTKDGIEKEVCEVVLNGFASVLQLLDSKSKDNQAPQSKMSNQDSQAMDNLGSGLDELDDDIPF